MKRGRKKLLKDVVRKNSNKLYNIALKNTKRNEDGLTVVEKGDTWRDEDEKPERYQLSRKKITGILVANS